MAHEPSTSSSACVQRCRTTTDESEDASHSDDEEMQISDEAVAGESAESRQHLFRSFVAALFLAQDIKESPIPKSLLFSRQRFDTDNLHQRLFDDLKPYWKSNLLDAIAV
eukprot:GABV01009603.1.p2 GENE.GABV01009603.1~~GABV01009603.1.p2  ORF type:complete len:110 (-),score=34.50 GABV01009603.1:118-447(-)